MPATDHPRSIRSFVTRSGRITEAQQRALARLWPKYGIEFSATRLEAVAVYGRDAARTLESQHLTNVRIICHDAVEVLAQQIPPQWLQEILIFFPDPWPKKRHHKRRLLQGPFVPMLVDRLESGGVLRIATDWQPYALEILATLSGIEQLRNLAPDDAFVPRPPEREPTRFEQRGARLGHEVWDLAFRRS